MEEKLKESRDALQRLIVTDGVFSMDSNVALLKEISQLANQYGAMIFIDECHATRFFGGTGRLFIMQIIDKNHFINRGTEEYFGLNGRMDVINSTLGKALGGAAGGYTTGPEELINLLRHRFYL